MLTDHARPFAIAPLAGEVACGPAGVEWIVDRLSGDGAWRILIVAERDAIGDEHLRALTSALDERGMHAHVEAVSSGTPTSLEIDRVAQAVRDGDRDTIVAAGGDSAFATARMTAVHLAVSGDVAPRIRVGALATVPDFSTCGRSEEWYWNARAGRLDRASVRRPDLLAIVPGPGGSGARSLLGGVHCLARALEVITDPAAGAFAFHRAACAIRATLLHLLPMAGGSPARHAEPLFVGCLNLALAAAQSAPTPLSLFAASLGARLGEHPSAIRALFLEGQFEDARIGVPELITALEWPVPDAVGASHDSPDERVRQILMRAPRLDPLRGSRRAAVGAALEETAALCRSERLGGYERFRAIANQTL